MKNIDIVKQEHKAAGILSPQEKERLAISKTSRWLGIVLLGIFVAIYIALHKVYFDSLIATGNADALVTPWPLSLSKTLYFTTSQIIVVSAIVAIYKRIGQSQH